jgi:site-specific DNA-methyltransferase (adenine-specific)
MDASSSQGAGKLKNRVLNQGHIKTWDKAPDKAFFDELRRVAENVIIWGGNYFDLPPSRCFICWDKVQPWENFSQVEFAWTSFDSPAQLFRFDNRTGDKIHPTQKPVELYAYLLRKYAKPGDRIFDPMMGSQSSRIAAYKMGFDYVGCELDKEYFDKGCERFNRECKHEIKIAGHVVRQATLFDI